MFANVVHLKVIRLFTLISIFSMLFFCSLILPPTRFISRVRVEAMNEFHAFRYMQDKYSTIINRFPDALVLVESKNDFTYYNWVGVDITTYY